MEFTVITTSVTVPDDWTDESCREFDASPEIAELRAGLQAVASRWQARYGHIASVQEAQDAV